MKKKKPEIKPIIQCACGCGKWFYERGNKRFFNRQHKDNFINRERLRSQKKIWEILLEEADLRGYEVRKKGE